MALAELRAFKRVERVHYGNLQVNGTTVYTNLRAYREFDSYRRLQGHAAYAAVNIPLSGFFARAPHSQ